MKQALVILAAGAVGALALLGGAATAIREANDRAERHRLTMQAAISTMEEQAKKLGAERKKVAELQKLAGPTVTDLEKGATA